MAVTKQEKQRIRSSYQNPGDWLTATPLDFRGAAGSWLGAMTGLRAGALGASLGEGIAVAPALGLLQILAPASSRVISHAIEEYQVGTGIVGSVLAASEIGAGWFASQQLAPVLSTQVPELSEVAMPMLLVTQRMITNAFIEVGRGMFLKSSQK